MLSDDWMLCVFSVDTKKHMITVHQPGCPNPLWSAVVVRGGGEVIQVLRTFGANNF